MGNQNKVVKFRKRKTINIGVIVFLILFVYIAINVYLYFTKAKLSIYEVHEGKTMIDNHITGLILREEDVVHSTKAGYITYFQKEGARIAKNAVVYSVDESGQLYNVVSSNDIPVTISDKNNAEIRHEIRSFQNNFSDDNFSSIYEFKENAQSTVLDILSSTVIDQSQELLENNGITFSYERIPSQKSGILSYYTDSFEGVTPDTVSGEMFNIENYKRTSLRNTEMVPTDNPVYKLITSDKWSITLPLSKLQYDTLADRERVSFKILEDDFEMTAALKLTQRGDSYYAQLTMDKYLSKYLSDRFIDVEVNFDAVEGYKIPLSSIVEKEFYLVPLEYFSLGAESQDQGLIRKTYKENGEITYNFIATDIYYDDGAYAYIDTALFEPGAIIQSAADSKEYTLSQTSKLTGVYNVNLGYAVFKRIEVLTQNEEYCIVSKDTTNGLAAYDQIALDGSVAVEQGIIY